MAVATMLREYKVVKLYYRYYMLWVSKNESCASNVLTVIVIRKKRSSYARQKLILLQGKTDCYW